MRLRFAALLAFSSVVSAAGQPSARNALLSCCPQSSLLFLSNVLTTTQASLLTLQITIPSGSSKNYYNFRVLVNTDFETRGIQIPGVRTGDKVTGPSNTAVLCRLHS